MRRQRERERSQLFYSLFTTLNHWTTTLALVVLLHKHTEEGWEILPQRLLLLLLYTGVWLLLLLLGGGHFNSLIFHSVVYFIPDSHSSFLSSNLFHIPNYFKFSKLSQTNHNICPGKLANFLQQTHTHTLTSTCAQDTTTTTCWWWVGWLVWECSRTWPFSVAIFTQSQVFGLELDYVV